MRFPVKPVPVLAGLVALALSAPLDGARTAEWTRGTVGGGQVSRSVSGDGPFYTGHTTRVGPNGDTYSSTATCFDGIVDRCRRSYTATGPGGRTYSGERAGARGPFRARSIGRITGPNGGAVVVGRRHWR